VFCYRELAVEIIAREGEVKQKSKEACQAGIDSMARTPMPRSDLS